MIDLINVPGSARLHLAVADVQNVSAGGIYAAVAQSKLTLGVKAVQLSGQTHTQQWNGDISVTVLPAVCYNCTF